MHCQNELRRYAATWLSAASRATGLRSQLVVSSRMYLKTPGSKTKKAPFYPSLAITRLLTETSHVLAIELEISETGWRSSCGHGDKFAM